MVFKWGGQTEDNEGFGAADWIGVSSLMFIGVNGQWTRGIQEKSTLIHHSIKLGIKELGQAL